MKDFISRHLVSLVVLLAVVVTLPVAFFLVKQSQDIRQRAASSQPVTPTPTSSPYPLVTMALGRHIEGDGYFHTIGQKFTVELYLDPEMSPKSLVTGVSAQIEFNPEIIRATRISDITQDGFELVASSSSYLQRPFFIEKPNIVTQEISQEIGGNAFIDYAILANPQDTTSNYSGYIAEFEFEIVGFGTTPLHIHDRQVSAKGYGSTNLGGNSYGMTISVVGLPTVTPDLIGDLNGDNVVDILDYAIFVGDFGRTDGSSSDLDHDGDVDIFDYNLFVGNFGRSV